MSMPRATSRWRGPPVRRLRWVTAPVPPAPAGYSAPIWRDDTIDALVVINRDVDFPPLEDPQSITHPIDQFAGGLEKHLQVLMNVATFLVATEEIAYEEDIPTQIYAVVTNDPAYARWCRSWGGNLVEVHADGPGLSLTARGVTTSFGPGEVNDAVALAADETQYVAESLDTGQALLQPISRLEFSHIETVLSELQRAHDAGDLTEREQLQIIAIADAIRVARRGSVPNSTPRWKLVGAVGGGLIYLFEKFPSGVVKWIELAEKLDAMGWSELAKTIQDLVDNLPA